jgi:hypothetical protein
MLNRLTIEDLFSTGFQSTEMVIRLQDSANKGTAATSKVTTLKATVNLAFQNLVDYATDDELMIPTKSTVKTAYMAADDLTNDATQVTLTGITTHGIEIQVI